jgi:hypothetical protein
MEKLDNGMDKERSDNKRQYSQVVTPMPESKSDLEIRNNDKTCLQ